MITDTPGSTAFWQESPGDPLRPKSPPRSWNEPPSLTLLTLGGLVFLTLGAVLLKPQLILLGLIPFGWAGWVRLQEVRLFSHLSRHPVRGTILLKDADATVGRPMNLQFTLQNHGPVALQGMDVELRTCPGLSHIGRFQVDLPAESQVELNLELVPVRSGPVFFYGFSLLIYAPFRYAPKEYILQLPMVRMVAPLWAAFLKKFPPTEESRLDMRPVPGQDGEFSELRPYAPGDPPRAIVPSASLRQQKYIIQMSIPRIVGKWLIATDVSPATYTGLPGHSPFDRFAAGLPLLHATLAQSQAEIHYLAFRHALVQPRLRLRSSEVNPWLAEFRYDSPTEARLTLQDREQRLRDWIQWVFGLPLPELPTDPAEHTRTLNAFLGRLPKVSGRPKPEYSAIDSDVSLQEICRHIGLEMPTKTPASNGFEDLLDHLSRHPYPHVVVFSGFDPPPNADRLAPRFRMLQKRGVQFHFLLPDDDALWLRPHGRELLDLEWSIRLGETLRLFGKHGTITYYHPTTFQGQLRRLLRPQTPKTR